MNTVGALSTVSANGDSSSDFLLASCIRSPPIEKGSVLKGIHLLARGADSLRLLLDKLFDWIASADSYDQSYI